MTSSVAGDLSMNLDADDSNIENIKRYVWRHYPQVASPSECSPMPNDIAAELPLDVRDRFTRCFADFDDPTKESLSSDDAAVVMSVHTRLETKNFIEKVRDHDLDIARCQQCDHVLASPVAQQCLACGSSWRPTAGEEDGDRTKR
jgi:hypothetical protein